MSGGSSQLREYRIARRDGLDLQAACVLSGIDPAEAKLIDAEDAKNPPGPECFVPLTPTKQENDMSQVAEDFDPETGEVLSTAAPGRPVVEMAADGRLLMPVAQLFSHFIANLEDGQFDEDVTDALKDLAEVMNSQGARFGDRVKIKGKVAITLDFSLENGVFYIRSNFKTTKPAENRRNSLMWTTPDGKFTPNPPNQGQLFGVRDVTPHREIRDA